MLLDRERCIVCQRCTRFADEIAGDPFIELVERGAQQQIGIAEDAPFLSYFSGNVIQICPVGALTSEAYRFRSRPFDLVSSPAVAEHDACGSAIRVDHRRGKVMRRQAGDDPAVNEEWITDKDRFAFTYAHGDDRITYPQVRGADGALRPASWPEAFAVAARGLAAAQAAGGVGVLTGGRLTAEDAYAYGKFARVALGTNDVDFRARPLSAEETAFLAAQVVLTAPGQRRRHVRRPRVGREGRPGRARARGRGRRDLPAPAQGGPRRAHPGDRAGAVHDARPHASSSGRLVPTVPGAEPEAIRSLLEQSEYGVDSTAVVLVGERLATVPGALTAAAELAAKSGARLAWVPRRAGDRGAVEAGCLPNLLPGGRPVADASARVDVATAWGVDALPEAEGRDADGIVAALDAGDLGGLVIAGVDPADTADPAATRAAIEAAGFVVALDLRETEVTRAADVVLPVAPVSDKAGIVRQLGRAGAPVRGRAPQPGLAPGPADPRRHRGGDGRAARLPHGARGARRDGAARALGRRSRAPRSSRLAALAARPASTTERPSGLVLATWKQSIDNGRMQDGDKYLKATARPVVALVPQDVYDACGPTVTLTGDRGSVTLPAEVGDDLVAGVVWVPANSFGAGVLSDLASPGSRVRVEGGQA